ncbi:hypothetical protein ACS72_00250, partial [Acinetobacter sp. VT 511]
MVTVQDGATIRNRGFSDSNQHCAMSIKQGESYDFTVWAKAESAGTITVQLQDGSDTSISDSVTLHVEGGNTWKKYGLSLIGTETVLGQLALMFAGDISIDMVSLVPQNVWGADPTEEGISAT